MQRRSFINQGVTAATATFVTSSALATNAEKKFNPVQPFKLNYGIHDGMFKNSGGSNFVDQIQFAYDIGFRAIEDNGMMDRPVDEQKKIGDKLASLGMRMGVFVVAFRSLAIADFSYNWQTRMERQIFTMVQNRGGSGKALQCKMDDCSSR